MRRSRVLVVAAAAVLLVGLMPGIASAGGWTPGVKDQSTVPSESLWLSDGGTVTQTVTAGMTGDLTRVLLYCAFSGTADVSIRVGSSRASRICSSAGWWDFTFSAPLAHVTAGSQFTLQISPVDEDSVSFGIASSDYAGGAAAEAGNPIDNDGSPVTDFAFETYVMASPVTTYAWNPTSIVAGTSGTVTLTAATTYPALVEPQVGQTGASPAAPDSITYSVKLGSLPAWFTPTSVVCSDQILLADCSLANFQTGMLATGDGSAMTVTVAVTGTAAPPSSSRGSKGSASGTGCDTYQGATDPVDVCSDASADLAVIGPNDTPPPTSTFDAGTTEGGSPSPLLLLGGIFAAVVAMFAVKRTADRRSRS